MRALMKQTVSRLAADYTVLQDGEEMFKIHVPFALHTVKVEVSNASGHLCTMERAIVGDAPLTQRNMFRIFSAPDCEAGYIARRRRYHQLVKADTFDICAVRPRFTQQVHDCPICCLHRCSEVQTCR